MCAPACRAAAACWPPPHRPNRPVFFRRRRRRRRRRWRRTHREKEQQQHHRGSSTSTVPSAVTTPRQRRRTRTRAIIKPAAFHTRYNASQAVPQLHARQPTTSTPSPPLPFPALRERERAAVHCIRDPFCTYVQHIHHVRSTFCTKAVRPSVLCMHVENAASSLCLSCEQSATPRHGEGRAVTRSHKVISTPRPMLLRRRRRRPLTSALLVGHVRK